MAPTAHPGHRLPAAAGRDGGPKSWPALVPAPLLVRCPLGCSLARAQHGHNSPTKGGHPSPAKGASSSPTVQSVPSAAPCTPMVSLTGPHWRLLPRPSMKAGFGGARRAHGEARDTQHRAVCGPPRPTSAAPQLCCSGQGSQHPGTGLAPGEQRDPQPLGSQCTAGP